MNKSIIEAKPLKKETIPQFSDEYRKLHIRPWARLLARFIDLYVFGFILGIISELFFPSLFVNNQMVNDMLVVFFWFLVEPFFLCSCGTTLGKYLLKIKVTDLDGNALKLLNTYKRSFGVLMIGLAFRIPILFLFALVATQTRLYKTGTTYWDKDNFIVTHSNVGYVRGIVAFLIIFSGFGINLYDSYLLSS